MVCSKAQASLCLPLKGWGIAKGKYTFQGKSGSDYEAAFHISRKYLVLLHLQLGPQTGLGGGNPQRKYISCGEGKAKPVFATDV